MDYYKLVKAEPFDGSLAGVAYHGGQSTLPVVQANPFHGYVDHNDAVAYRLHTSEDDEEHEHNAKPSKYTDSDLGALFRNLHGFIAMDPPNESSFAAVLQAAECDVAWEDPTLLKNVLFYAHNHPGYAFESMIYDFLFKALQYCLTVTHNLEPFQTILNAHSYNTHMHLFDRQPTQITDNLLLTAIQYNQPEFLKACLLHHANPNFSFQPIDSEGDTTYLLFACNPKHTHLGIPQSEAPWCNTDPRMPMLLASAGAALEAKNQLGQTPLGYALWSCNPTLCAYLLQAGADEGAACPDFMHPMHHGIGSKYQDLMVPCSLYDVGRLFLEGRYPGIDDEKQRETGLILGGRQLDMAEGYDEGYHFAKAKEIDEDRWQLSEVKQRWLMLESNQRFHLSNPDYIALVQRERTARAKRIAEADEKARLQAEAVEAAKATKKRKRTVTKRGSLQAQSAALAATYGMYSRP